MTLISDKLAAISGVLRFAPDNPLLKMPWYHNEVMRFITRASASEMVGIFLPGVKAPKLSLWRGSVIRHAPSGNEDNCR